MSLTIVNTVVIDRKTANKRKEVKIFARGVLRVTKKALHLHSLFGNDIPKDKKEDKTIFEDIDSATKRNEAEAESILIN